MRRWHSLSRLAGGWPCLLCPSIKAILDNTSCITQHRSPVVDFGSLVVMAGLVDSHVHVNDPGRTDWERFDTCTRAAAAGGNTTIADMPLNSIPSTTSSTNLKIKKDAAADRLVSVMTMVASIPLSLT